MNDNQMQVTITFIVSVAIVAVVIGLAIVITQHSHRTNQVEAKHIENCIQSVDNSDEWTVWMCGGEPDTDIPAPLAPR